MRSSQTPLRFRTLPSSVLGESRTLYLDKIRHRKIKPKPQTNAFLASSVLKLYFLPYFSDLYKTKENNQRKSRYGNRSPTISPVSTKYTRLADILKEYINQAQFDLKNLNNKLQTIESDKNHIINEISKYKSIIANHKGNLNIINYQKKIFQIWIRNFELSKTSIQNKMIKFKDKSWKSKEKYIKLQQKYCDEKISNDMLKNKTQQYQHWHCLHQMINQVNGESLKGVYYAVDGMINKESLEGKMKMMHGSCEMMNGIMDKKLALYVMNTVHASRQRYRFLNQANKHAKERFEVFKQLKALRVSIVEYMENLILTLKSNETECENLSLSTKNKEKEIVDFSSEYEGIQEKLREAQALHRSSKPELICKTCNRTYIELENYNWSCSVHTSEWSGSMYWCCGSVYKESIGCQKRKHQERKDEDYQEALVFSILTEDKQGPTFCTNCKTPGHTSQKCSFDPNSPNTSFTKNKHKIRVRMINQNLKKKLNRILPTSKLKNNNFSDIYQIKTIASTSVSPEPSLISEGGLSSKSFIKIRSETPTFKSIH
ncbi:hypothetical protein SteCoe_11803 [Stentor coeruleus]|uniref:Uncharacterized protein n=1 Tax=Stentor coeruleus TaxID=5963 RepID=A0A1R2CCC2_9CILI|nr:hypothetical protein SteCoe_11803 [Stentor coeruleus]